MPRFVLLHHECPPGSMKPSHWDFMLEAEGVLWTWELRELPAAWQLADGETRSRDHESVTILRLADHRLDYLEYEGSLTENRGYVTRIARGKFEILENYPERLVARLDGNTLKGIIELIELNQKGRWLLSVRD